MGDMGDTFREWKQHRKDCKAASALGLSLSAYHRAMADADRELAEERRKVYYGKCTLLCECGRWFLDTNAHNCHKQSVGKKGHRVIETKEPEIEAARADGVDVDHD